MVLIKKLPFKIFLLILIAVCLILVSMGILNTNESSDEIQNQIPSETTRKDSEIIKQIESELYKSPEESRKERIELFGVQIYPPIDSGYVFFDGIYQDVPYEIKREGLDVFINDQCIQRVVTPNYNFDMKVVSDPGFPVWLNEDSTLNDLNRDVHSIRKWLYLKQNYPLKEAKLKMIEYYKNMPFLKSVRVPKEEDDNIVDIEYLMVVNSKGREFGIRIAPIPDSVFINKDNINRKINQDIEVLKMRLKANANIFFFDDAQYQLSLGKSNFIRVIKILEENTDVKTRIEEIKMGKYISNEECLKILAERYSHNDELCNRLRNSLNTAP